MIGRNGIRIIYGDKPGQMVKELLEAIRPEAEAEIEKDTLIGIKPNLVVAKPSDSGATTSPEIVAGIIEYLKSKGHSNIVIMEGSWVGDRTSEAFRVCGYEDLSREYGVPLIDLQKDRSRTYEADGMRISVCDHVMKVGYLINVPVMKGHCQTKMTCALKNMKGCIPDSEKRRFHTMGLHKPIAYLNKIIKQDLIIVDGMNGDLNFEEGGNPVRMNRIFAGKDPVLIDAYAAYLMGFSVEEIPYIGLAERIGVGTADLENADIVELNSYAAVSGTHDSDVSSSDAVDRHVGTTVPGTVAGPGRLSVSMRVMPGVLPGAAPTGKVRQLAAHIVEDCACSACYGSLIHALERLREKDMLNRLEEKLYIGQGFRGRRLNAPGIGSCTSGFDRYVKGCPPKARDIVEYLEGMISAT